MAKDRTRHARRRSGYFYSARRMQSFMRASCGVSHGLRNLGMSFDCAFASASRFAEALDGHQCNELKG
jgi:hypothetical protein